MPPDQYGMHRRLGRSVEWTPPRFVAKVYSGRDTEIWRRSLCGRTIVGLQAVQQGLIRWARTLAIVVSIAAAGLIFFLGVFKSNRAQLLPALSQSGSIQASVLIEVISMSFEARRIAKMKKNPGD